MPSASRGIADLLVALRRRPDVAALVPLLVFGAFVNAAVMIGLILMWTHRWHARLGSMLTAVTLLFFVGLALARAVVLVFQRARKDYRFVLALIPLGFGMWLAHRSYHLVVA